MPRSICSARCRPAQAGIAHRHIPATLPPAIRFWWKCSDLGESIGLLKTLGWVCEEPRPFSWGHLLEATFGLPSSREHDSDNDKEGVPDEDVVSNEVLLHDNTVKLVESSDDGQIKLYIRDVSTLVDHAGSIEAAKPMVLHESDDFVALASEEVAIRSIFPHEIDTFDPYEGEVRVWEL